MVKMDNTHFPMWGRGQAPNMWQSFYFRSHADHQLLFGAASWLSLLLFLPALQVHGSPSRDSKTTLSSSDCWTCCLLCGFLQPASHLVNTHHGSRAQHRARFCGAGQEGRMWRTWLCGPPVLPTPIWDYQQRTQPKVSKDSYIKEAFQRREWERK